MINKTINILIERRQNMKPEEMKKEILTEEPAIQDENVEVECEEENGFTPPRLMGMLSF